MPQLNMSAGTLSIFIAILAFILVYIFIIDVANKRRTRLQDRLTNTRDLEIEYMIEAHNENATPYSKFYKKHLKNTLFKDSNRTQKIAKLLKVNLESLYSRIREAKLENKVTPEEILSMKLVGYVGMITLLIVGLLSVNLPLLLLSIVFMIVGVIFPDRWISKCKVKKDESIERSLPSFLETLSSVLEAGLSLETGINEVSSRMGGHLAEEFLSVQAETKTKRDWNAAMENMAIRNNIDALSDVVSDILIAKEKGVEIKDALDHEAVFMTELRISKANEKANSLTVKILIPLAIFFFIPFMIMILSPLVLKMASL